MQVGRPNRFSVGDAPAFLGAVVVLLVFLLSAPPGAPGPTTLAPGAPLASERTGLSPAAPPTFLPLPPRALHGALPSHALAVSPYNLYSAEPAPMGIADFGVDQNGTGYTYSTSTFLGTAVVGKLGFQNSALGSYQYDGTLQLNVVLFFVSGGRTFGYWIQDVLYVTTSSNLVYFENNIWNFTSGSSAGMLSSTVSGNGSVSTYNGQGYYATSASPSLGGNGVTLSYPATIQLRVVATLHLGTPRVYFSYADGYGWQTYDTADFVFTRSVASAAFRVDGQNYIGGFLYDDAELSFGGPGSGYSTTMTRGSVNLSLAYDNGQNLQLISNAYTFGSDTAEAVGSVAVSRIAIPASDTLESHLTAGSGSPANLYDRGTISLFNGSTILSSGTYSLNGTVRGGFRNHGLNLTLPPGSYDIGLLVNGTLAESANVTLAAGEYLAYNFNPPPLYNLSFESSGLPAGTLWSLSVGSATRGTTTSALLYRVPNGTYSYQVGLYPGYHPTPTQGSVTVNGADVVVKITWTAFTYPVSATETGLPVGMSWSVLVGSSVHSGTSSTFSFALANGTYSYTVGYVAGYRATVPSGTVGVAGGSTGIAVTFVRVLYSVQFTETGLPAATGWIVALQGTNYSTAAPSISLNLPNGSYLFAISTGAPYAPVPAVGAVNVNGSAGFHLVTFTPLPATIGGQLSPAGASVRVNGTMVTVDRGNFSVTLPPGNYSIEVSSPGYRTSWRNVTVQPGQRLTLLIQLEKLPSPGPLSPSGGNGFFTPLTLLLLVGIAAVALIGVAAYARNRRRPPRPVPA